MVAVQKNCKQGEPSLAFDLAEMKRQQMQAEHELKMKLLGDEADRAEILHDLRVEALREEINASKLKADYYSQKHIFVNEKSRWCRV